MNVRFKIQRVLLASVRADLSRPHPFASERVGFISAGLASAGNDLLVLAREFQALDDDEYLQDPSYGALMGPDAIRRALQTAITTGSAMFHVHQHHGTGVPYFSPLDLTENDKFVPDFFKVAPKMAHGTIVLSSNAASGQIWFSGNKPHQAIQDFVEVGAPMRKWSGR